MATATRRNRRSPTKEQTGASLPADQLLLFYERMLRSRLLDLRMWALSRQGKAHFVITSQGHEAAEVGSASALRPGYDWLVPYYRDLAAVLSFGMSPQEVLLGLMGKEGDPSSRGRQMPAHYSRADLHIVTRSSCIATQMPHAVGIALASKLRGSDEVTIVYFGDGSTSKGDTHESMNWAGIYRLPMVFFCENNGVAISTPLGKQMAIRDIAERAAGYGFPGVVVDGNDFFAVHQAACEAVARARSGGGPTLVECKTMRMRGHAIHDNMAYVPKALLEEWSRRDPLLRFEAALRERGLLDEARLAELERRISAEIDDAQAYAESSPYPDPSTLTSGVYA